MLEDLCKRGDSTLLRYAPLITEQKKCWDLLAQTFDRFQTLCNNSQQHETTCNRVSKRTQHVKSSNVGSYWPTLSEHVASFFFHGALAERVLLREISLPRPLLYCGMLIKPALNQYNWQKTFIQSLSYYVLITISQYFETRPRPLDHREQFRWRAFSIATAIMSVMNLACVQTSPPPSGKIKRLRFLFHVFN